MSYILLLKAPIGGQNELVKARDLWLTGLYPRAQMGDGYNNQAGRC